MTATPEAVVRLDLRGPEEHSEVEDAVLDTGFTGYLALPSALVDALRLPHRETSEYLLADGNVAHLNVFRGIVVWDGRDRDVLVVEIEGGPLIGMSLLYGHEVRLQVVDGGAVTIDALPPLAIE